MYFALGETWTPYKLPQLLEKTYAQILLEIHWTSHVRTVYLGRLKLHIPYLACVLSRNPIGKTRLVKMNKNRVKHSAKKRRETPASHTKYNMPMVQIESLVHNVTSRNMSIPGYIYQHLPYKSTNYPCIPRDSGSPKLSILIIKQWLIQNSVGFMVTFPKTQHI